MMATAETATALGEPGLVSSSRSLRSEGFYVVEDGDSKTLKDSRPPR